MRLRRIVLAAAVLAVAGAPLHAQSLLERPPNLAGGWTGVPGSAYFNFLHRFDVSPAPARQVSNSPTFLLGYTLPGSVLLGANYATKSLVAPAFPNEWEFFARAAPLRVERGFPADVAVQAGYNLAAESVDGEVALARSLGRLRVLAAARAFSNAYFADEARFAAAAGAVLTLHRYVALAGDVAALFDRAEDEEPAWGAALQLAIPYTPHTFSLQATNTRTGTLQGASRGSSETHYGFEFTVPITLSRYFGTRTAASETAEPPPPESGAHAAASPRDTAGTPPPQVTAVVAADTAEAAVPPPAESPPAAAQPARREPPAATAPARSAQPAQSKTVTMRQLQYRPARIVVAPGTTIVWRNNDVVPHTVTSDSKAFDSGLIEPGRSWSRTFTRRGTFPYTCTPHPFMKGVVVVE